MRDWQEFYAKTYCVFREATHQYFLIDAVSGEIIKELISVTTLMRKHGLAPNYDGVPSDILKAKAEYGNLIHKELEQYIKYGEIGFSQELQEFITYCKKYAFKPTESEFIVYNDVVAGTADVLGILQMPFGVCPILGDFKTTATLHKDAVSWQLSIYKKLYEQQCPTAVIEMLQAFHFNDGLKVVEIAQQMPEEIEKLFEAERNGETYEQRQLVLAEDLEAQVFMAEKAIQELDAALKATTANAQKLREMLLEKMREGNYKSFENERMKITYIAPSTRETIDSARLKKELPEIAAQYKKTSNVKDSVRITLKGENKENE